MFEDDSLYNDCSSLGILRDTLHNTINLTNVSVSISVSTADAYTPQTVTVTLDGRTSEVTDLITEALSIREEKEARKSSTAVQEAYEHYHMLLKLAKSE